MRIALVTESFYPAVDSATTTVKQVADRLIDYGHEVLIVAPGPGIGSYRRSRIARVRTLAPSSGSGAPKVGAQVRDALAEFTPDLVQVHSPGALGRKALKHASRQGVRTLTVQQSVVGDLTADYWLRKVAHRSDKVLVTCEWMHHRLADLGVHAPVWRPGVDARAFGPQLRDDWLHGKWSRRKSPDGPRVVVGYVGSLHKRNGVRRLPEVSGLDGVRLVVMGEGAQRPWLKLRMPEAKFVGAMEPGELAGAMATIDILVHPGVAETDCHTHLEAAASRVPVVAPGVGGTTDVVRHQETGLLYDPAEDAGLVRAVTTLVDDPLRRTVLGVQARAAAETRSWKDSTDELVATHHAALLGSGLHIA